MLLRHSKGFFVKFYLSSQSGRDSLELFMLCSFDSDRCLGSIVDEH